MTFSIAAILLQVYGVHALSGWPHDLPDASGNGGMYFQISVLGKDLCLDVQGGKSYNGAPIDIWECNGLENQLWYFDADSYAIKYAGDSTKCIDAGDMTTGSALKLWDCNGLAQQQIGYDSNAHTIYSTATSRSNAASCFDVLGGDATPGTLVQLWDCSGAWNQQWNVLAGLTIRVQQGGTDFCLDLQNGDTSDGTPVALWQCNGLVNQLWYFDGVSYSIKYAADQTKCIDAGDMNSGTQLKLWTCNKDYPQQQLGYDVEMRTIYLADSTSTRSPDASMCVDIVAGALNNGNPLQVWNCNGCWNQHFSIIGPASLASLSQHTNRSFLVSPEACPPAPAPPSPGAKPTMVGVNVCNSDNPNLKLSFGKDTLYFQWKRQGDPAKPDRNVDCEVDYSIGYSGSDPWYEGGLQLPDKICGQELPIRIHIHSSFEDLDVHEKINGQDHKIYLKREMKDGLDHCGHCTCGDCHYDCSNFGELTSGGPQHRRRGHTTAAPTPAPADCPCKTECPLDTVTRRRQFQSARFKSFVSV